MASAPSALPGISITSANIESLASCSGAGRIAGDDIPNIRAALAGLGGNPGRRSDTEDVGHDVDHRRLSGGERLIERALDLAWIGDPDAEASHVTGELGEVGVREDPELIRVARP